jgi:hypothetical protein
MAILFLALIVGVAGGYFLFGQIESWLGRTWESIILTVAPAAFGFLVWRLEGHRLAVIATWTVPLFAATVTSVYLLTGVPSVALYLLCVAFLVAMILTRSGPNAWRRLFRL